MERDMDQPYERASEAKQRVPPIVRTCSRCHRRFLLIRFGPCGVKHPKGECCHRNEVEQTSLEAELLGV